MESMDKKKDMLEEQEAVSTASVSLVDSTPKTEEESEDDNEDDKSLIIKLKNPYKFEGKEYNEIDLSGLENISAKDMIAVNKYMDRTATGIQVLPEVSLEYACVIASKVTPLPVEFFLGLPGKTSMKLKNRVMGFLFGSE